MKVYIDVKNTDFPIDTFITELQDNTLDLSGATLLAEVTRRTPKDQGRLQGSWEDSYKRQNNTITIATNVEYAPYVEEGTGVYGPRATPIKPNGNYGGRGNVLSWIPGKKGRGHYKIAGDGYVYFKQVKGQEGKHMVRDGIEAMQRKLPNIVRIAASKTGMGN